MSFVSQFVIIIVTASSSIASTVLTIDPGLHKCPPGGYYGYFDEARKYQYYVHIQVNTTDIKVETDFENHILYAQVDHSTVNVSAYAKRAPAGECNNLTTNDKIDWELFWQHTGHAVAAARIVQNVSHGHYQMAKGDCELTVITTDERWIFKNGTYETIKFPLEMRDHSLIREYTARQLGFACLKKRICPRVKTFLENASPDISESRPLITAIVNNAVDILITDNRKYIKNNNEKINIPDVNLTSYTESLNMSDFVVFTGGTLTNLETIERAGDAILTIEPDHYNVTCTYIIPETRVHYDHYGIYTATLNKTGEAFMSMKDLKFERKTAFHAESCDPISQHISIKGIGEFTYWDANFYLVKFASHTMKAHFEHSMQKILNNFLYVRLDYRSAIFGSCLSRGLLEFTNVAICPA